MTDGEWTEGKPDFIERDGRYYVSILGNEGEVTKEEWDDMKSRFES